MKEGTEKKKVKEKMLGNGVVGIVAESVNKWERRAPLTPSHCARLLNNGVVARIIVQPSTKRIHHDALYEDVGCHVSEDLSNCGLILGIKNPKVFHMIITDDKMTLILSAVDSIRLLDVHVYIHLCLLQLDMILPDRAYAFFSHTHKAQKENMPLLDKVANKTNAFFHCTVQVVLLTMISDDFSLLADFSRKGVLV